MPSGPILVAERVTKRYGPAPAPLTVLRDVGFELQSGETLALTGPSGSGKSTLLGLCAGLDSPSEGRVILAGSDLGRLDEEARARVRRDHVGFIFQNFQLLPSLTARENVQAPMELRRVAGSRAAAERALESVGLGGRFGHYPAQLSGGEQQRVALARALAGKPDILFADEPTGNLDEETADHVADLLFRMHADSGAALVLVTHNPELAARCGRQLRLRGGAVVSA